MLICRHGVRERVGKPWADHVKAAALLAGLVGVCPAPAQTTTRPSGTAALAVHRPEYTSTTEVSDVLLGSPRRQVVLLPSQPGEAGEDPEQLSQGTQQKLQPETLLLPEGYVVAAREARITHQEKWYVAELAREEGLPTAPPLRVLPNQRLAMLEAILSEARKAPAFVVTGRVTEFLGANYILLENLEEISPRATPVSVTPKEPADSTTATRPAAGGEPTAEEIMQQLLEHKTVRPVVLPDRAPVDPRAAEPGTEGEPSTSGAESQGLALPEETLLIDRTGRVLPGEVWWTFVFEDQGQNPRRPPIRLLPNQLLETAISLTRGGTQGVVLIVSGEVTLHRGMNYLLLRKVLVRRDLGNLR